MQHPDDRTRAPAIHADEPPSKTRYTLLIVIAVALTLAIGVVLHVTGVVGPG
jgi:hypothetical protein